MWAQTTPYDLIGHISVAEMNLYSATCSQILKLRDHNMSRYES